MIKHLFNKLPAVRRLHSQLAIAAAEAEALKARLRHADSELEGGRRDLAECEEELDGVRKKRNELFRMTDELRSTIITQAATLDAWKIVRNHNEQLIAEQKLSLADLRSREERWHNTVQALNGSLNDRNATLADLREELAAAQEEIAKRTRPVLFALEGGLADDVLAEALAGKAKQLEVKALLQLLDGCAVEAMNEAASAPVVAITDGPHAGHGFTGENRTFSAGGVFALTELKRRALELLAPKVEAPEKGRAAA